MKKKIYTLLMSAGLAAPAMAQLTFPVNIDTAWSVKTVWMPKSPLKYQNIFIGGQDIVQTTATYTSPAGSTVAKQWHDYIGFVNDNSSSGDLGWAVVNHEMISADPKIGDGGGMTMFKLKKKPNSDSLAVVTQTLADGRVGKFFNVDFVNTVGETGMNCGGITTPAGRMWTAEEWMQNSNTAIFSGGTGFKDTSNFIIGTTTPAGFPGFNGKVLKRYQNLNWMVEINPLTAKGVRKQYNWGRAGWEGGVVMADNKTVYLFEDAAPGIFGKFVATTANDFTSGQMYVYKHDAPTFWIPIENNIDTLMNLNKVAVRRGASMFNRLEWGQQHNGKIYICETGRDVQSYNTGNNVNGVIAPTLVDGYKTRYLIKNGVAFPGTNAAAADSVRAGKFFDYYGRVDEFDPATNLIRSYIEGGPLASSATSQSTSAYPAIHLSNPDGVDFMTIGTKTYMIIQEDLNGVNWNRMPAGYPNTNCETYLLDMSIANPTYSNCIRITACPPGAEITGATMIANNNIMLINSQHPSASNTPPYNNSLTYAITGFNGIFNSLGELKKDTESLFTIYPNPTSRELNLSKEMDVAIYNSLGQRIKVVRDTKTVNVSDLASGVYFISNTEGKTVKFIVE
jgi:secreted PhoX family phosphatase